MRRDRFGFIHTHIHTHTERERGGRGKEGEGRGGVLEKLTRRSASPLCRARWAVRLGQWVVSVQTVGVGDLENSPPRGDNWLCVVEIVRALRV